MISLTNPYVLLGGVCGAALLCAVSFGVGHHQKTLEDASAALAGARRAVQVVAQSGAINSAVDQKVVAAITKAHANTITLIQKVPVYVPRKADDQCIVGVGAVRLLDAAARDPVPEPAIGLQDADSGVALSELVSDDIANAGSFRQLAERLTAWDDWYTAQKALAEGR